MIPSLRNEKEPKPPPNRAAADVVRAIVADIEDRRWIKARWRELQPKTRAIIFLSWFRIVSAAMTRCIGERKAFLELLRDIRDAAEYGDADDWSNVVARLRYVLKVYL